MFTYSAYLRGNRTSTCFMKILDYVKQLLSPEWTVTKPMLYNMLNQLIQLTVVIEPI